MNGLKIRINTVVCSKLCFSVEFTFVRAQGLCSLKIHVLTPLYSQCANIRFRLSHEGKTLTGLVPLEDKEISQHQA